MICLPETPLPSKPRYGSPCNGCGFCCQMQICWIGEKAFPGAVAPCPGLRVTPERTYCSLVEAEIESGLPPILQLILGIGFGCDSRDESNAT